MENKKDNKVVITGKMICFVVGIISFICGCYWLYQIIFNDADDFPNMLLAMVAGSILTKYGAKKTNE